MAQREKIIKVPPEAAGIKLSDYLVSQGYIPAMDCGGIGTCGKCRVKLLSGSFDGTVPDETGMVRSCRAVCSAQGADISLPERFSKKNVIKISSEGSVCSDNSQYGLALDVGTTTIAAALVFLKENTVVATDSRLNPQRVFGADVMSRIAAADDGKLSVLQSVVLECVSDIINSLLRQVGATFLKAITVVGNPTMLHLFCGISPSDMGQYPFTPVFTEAKCFSGEKLSLPAETVYILPSADAFIGSDVTAGVLKTQMYKHTEPSILMDIGTNGEMVLCSADPGKNMLAVSTAAGPAFEGAGISCGIGGVQGAISQVKIKNGQLRYKTVGNCSPVGICGSGLIDLIAQLRQISVIDETGYMEEPFLIAETAYGTSLFLTPEDVREFQMAKSAIRAGFETLLSESGLSVKDIKNIYLAGGLGVYMNPENAADIGLIPPDLGDKVTAIGNSALDGAVLCLSDAERRTELERIAVDCRIVELSVSEVFQNAFMENMLFPCDAEEKLK